MNCQIAKFIQDVYTYENEFQPVLYITDALQEYMSHCTYYWQSTVRQQHLSGIQVVLKER